MAAPITHIVLADQVFNTHFSDKDKAKFFIGTSFPDIRYLGTIEREKTHLNTVSLNEIKNEDSFMSGLKLHVYIDRIREDFITAEGIYKLAPESKYTVSAIKLLEDEYLYEKVQNWESVTKYFDQILDEEISFGLSKEDIQKWHNLLQTMMSRKPDLNSLRYFAQGLNLGTDAIDEILQLMEEMRQKEEVKGIIYKFYDTFPTNF